MTQIFSSEAAIRGLLALDLVEKPLTLTQFKAECGLSERHAENAFKLLVEEGYVAAPKAPGHGSRGKYQMALTPRGQTMAKLLRAANDHGLRRPSPAH